MSGDERRRERAGDEGPFGFDRKKAIVTAVVAVALVSGAIALVGQIANFDAVAKAARAADKRWLPLCAFGQLLGYCGYVLAYRDVARACGGPRLPLGAVARVVGIGFGAFALGSTPGGLALDFWALHRAGAPTHESARRVLGLNTLEWGLLSFFAMLSALAVLSGRGEGAPLVMTLSWIVAVPLALAAAVWVSAPGRVERLTKLPRGRGGSLREGPRTWVATKGRAAFADAVGGVAIVRHLVRHPFRYPGALGGCAVYWIGQLLTLWSAVQAFAGGPLVPAALILAFATGYAASALPLPAGGAGGIDAALAFSMQAVGVPLAAALLAAVVYRIFTFWLPIVPALGLLPSIKRLNEELPRAERETA